MAKKAKDAFRTISEVADWLDVPAHVLRFWESKFPQIKPVKRAGGRRYYRPSDMRLIGGIKTLLHDQGVTIRGVQLKLKDEGIDAVSELSQPVTGTAPPSKPKIIKATPPVDEVVDAPVQVDAPIQDTVPDDQEDAAPFIDVPEDMTTGGDNVVEMSSRDRRRADLEEQASRLDTEQHDDAPEDTAEEPAHHPEAEPSPEHASEPEPTIAAEPITELTPDPELVPNPELTPDPEPTPAPESTPEPEPQPVPIAAQPMPDFSQVNASQARRESLDTITKLRRWDPTLVQNREQIQYLEHRVRTLRDKMAAALKNT